MKTVKKKIVIIGIMILLLFVLSACGNSELSSPEATFKNYFSLVQDMEFEGSYEYMNFDLRTQFKSKLGEDQDEDVPEEVKSLKSYQEYTSEVAKLYKEIDYEIVDIVNEGSIGSDPKFEARDYLVRITTPNIDQIIEKSAMNSIGHLLGALFIGEIDLETHDEIYRSLVEDIKNENIEGKIIEGIIGIREYTKIDLRASNFSIPERENDDDFDIVWGISYMDENILNALTFMENIHTTAGSDELLGEYDNQELAFNGKEEFSETEEDTVEARAEKSRQAALENLERSDEPVEGDLTEKEMAILTEDLESLIDFLSKDFSGFLDGVGDYFSSIEYSESIAGQTEGWMGEQLNFILRDMHYSMDPETAEWFYSDTDGVYQFAVSLKAEGEEELVISGNYNKEERFFKVFKLHGTPPFGDYAS